MRTNTPPVQIDDEKHPYTDRFIDLSSNISRDEETDLDIQGHLNKARNSLNMLNKVALYRSRSKLKLYHSCVLYG